MKPAIHRAQLKEITTNRNAVLTLSLSLSLALALATAMPTSVRAAENLLVSHIIRLGFASDVTTQAREDSIRTFNRFKQIKGPTLVVVGRDVSATDDFEYTQITTFESEQGWRDYFYDPIHLAADREADTLKAISRGASFDIFPVYDAAEAAQIVKINTDRSERFRRNDDRPTSPPVPDRPEDQVWSLGDAIIYVARFSDVLDVAAFTALMDAAGDQVVASGRLLGGTQADQVNYGAVIRFANEAAWRDVASSQAMTNVRAAGLYKEHIRRSSLSTRPMMLSLIACGLRSREAECTECRLPKAARVSYSGSRSRSRWF